MPAGSSYFAYPILSRISSKRRYFDVSYQVANRRITTFRSSDLQRFQTWKVLPADRLGRTPRSGSKGPVSFDEATRVGS